MKVEKQYADELLHIEKQTHPSSGAEEYVITLDSERADQILYRRLKTNPESDTRRNLSSSINRLLSDWIELHGTEAGLQPPVQRPSSIHPVEPEERGRQIRQVL